MNSTEEFDEVTEEYENEVFEEEEEKHNSS